MIVLKILAAPFAAALTLLALVCTGVSRFALWHPGHR